MIVTEIDSSPEDSEGCSNVEVVELVERENIINYDIVKKSMGYYLEEEDINNDCCNLILDEISRPFSSSEELEFEGYFLSHENNSKEFKVESFTKTLKTLVDIVTEPIVDECPSVSSTGSESSDYESFSIMPMLKTLSTKFIKQTSKFFRTDDPDLIDLDIVSSDTDDSEDVGVDNRDVGKQGDDNLSNNNNNIDRDNKDNVNKANKVNNTITSREFRDNDKENKSNNNYQIDEDFLDVKEYWIENESNQIKNYPTKEFYSQKSIVHDYYQDVDEERLNERLVEIEDEYTEEEKKKDMKMVKNKSEEINKEREKDRDSKNEDNKQDNKEKNEEKDKTLDNNKSKVEENNNVSKDNKSNNNDKEENNNNEKDNNNNEWNLSNLAKWF